MVAVKMTISVPSSLSEQVKAYDAISPSAVCQAALRAAVEEAEGDARLIVVQGAEGLEGFYGKWIIDPDSDEAATTEALTEYGEVVWDAEERWGIAVTEQGALVTYTRKARILTLENLCGIGQCHIPEDVRERAIEAAEGPGGHKDAINIHRDW